MDLPLLQRYHRFLRSGYRYPLNHDGGCTALDRAAGTHIMDGPTRSRRVGHGGIRRPGGQSIDYGIGDCPCPAANLQMEADGG